MSIHLELEFQIVLTVVVTLAAGVAGWRLIKALSGRSAGEQQGGQDDGD